MCSIDDALCAVDQQEEESQDSPASELDASIPLQAEKDLPQTEPVQEHFASEDAICLVEKPVISIEAGACGDTEDRQQPIELQNEGIVIRLRLLLHFVTMVCVRVNTSGAVTLKL